MLDDYAHYRRSEAASAPPTVTNVTGMPRKHCPKFAHHYADTFP